ncbi:hypothetical protein AX16_003556 [Volvariella volvacea WC 439]|nr:hypothetical protein AX16_003556 [Volvariella volvacea WC 439]
MRVFTIPSLLSIATTVLASPVRRHAGEVLAGHYIVKIKPGASPTSLLRTSSDAINFTHTWETDVGFNGFAGQFNDETLKALENSLDVEFIAEDGYVSLQDFPEPEVSIQARVPVVQPNAPWNLARISSIQPPPLPNYYYDSTAGQGSVIYLLDTGVYIEHSEFGGRASHGPAFGVPSPTDGNGHGTHTAGVAIGTTYGVAKLASLVSVKILSDSGSGSVSNIISGINWAVTTAVSSSQRATILLPIGGGANTALDNAVASAVSAGVTVSVPAGSSNADAGNFSPARVPSAITVAASTSTDARASFSNYGSVIDIFAPGQNIIGPWIGSLTATATLSGTASVAHVSGVIAYYQRLYGPLNPSQIGALLTKHCQGGGVIVPPPPAGTTTCLVYNGNTP